MKYLCEGCSRLVTLERFRVTGDTLTAFCPACGAESHSDPSDANAPQDSARAWPPVTASISPPAFAPPQAASASASAAAPTSARRLTPTPHNPPAPPPAAPRSVCPKCAAPRREDRDNCPRCGLTFALFDPSDFELPPMLESLWRSAENSNDPDRHRAFLDAATRAAALHEAARRYRLRAEQRPHDALAARFRDEAIDRLMATTRLPEPTRLTATPAKLRPLWVALMLLLAAGLAYVAFTALAGGALGRH